MKITMEELTIASFSRSYMLTSSKLILPGKHFFKCFIKHSIPSCRELHFVHKYRLNLSDTYFYQKA